MDILSYVLVYICHDVHLETQYRSFVDSAIYPSVKCELLGIGSIHSWHGSPNECVTGRALVFFVTEADDAGNGPSDIHRSEGGGQTSSLPSGSEHI